MCSSSNGKKSLYLLWCYCCYVRHYNWHATTVFYKENLIFFCLKQIYWSFLQMIFACLPPRQFIMWPMLWRLRSACLLISPPLTETQFLDFCFYLPVEVTCAGLIWESQTTQGTAWGESDTLFFLLPVWVKRYCLSLHLCFDSDCNLDNHVKVSRGFSGLTAAMVTEETGEVAVY